MSGLDTADNLLKSAIEGLQCVLQEIIKIQGVPINTLYILNGVLVADQLKMQQDSRQAGGPALD